MRNPVSFFLTFLRYLDARSIRDEAILNVDGCPWRTKAILGRPRPFDPINDPEHARLAEEANIDREIELRAFELDAREREKAKHARRWVLVPFLAVCFLVEGLSCVQVFAAQGDEMPERGLYGLGLAALFMVLVFFATQHAAPNDVEVSK